MLVIEYHTYIWRVLPQLSCGDTCQIWMWCKGSKRHFGRIENFAYREINEQSYSNPHPRIMSALNPLGYGSPNQESLIETTTETHSMSYLEIHPTKTSTTSVEFLNSNDESKIKIAYDTTGANLWAKHLLNLKEITQPGVHKSLPLMQGKQVVKRARLGRVAPLAGLDQYTRAQIHYKLSQWPKWPKWYWRSRSMPSIFNTSWEYPSIPGCMFGANLVIVAQICDELSHGQAKFPRSLHQNGQNDLEGQCQWPPFSIPAESIPRHMFQFGANLVIPAQTCDELSCGQGKVYGRMDGRTDTGNDNIPSAWKAKG